MKKIIAALGITLALSLVGSVAYAHGNPYIDNHELTIADATDQATGKARFNTPPYSHNQVVVWVYMYRRDIGASQWNLIGTASASNFDASTSGTATKVIPCPDGKEVVASVAGFVVQPDGDQTHRVDWDSNVKNC